MSAHTPGPWEARRVDDRWEVVQSETRMRGEMCVGWVEVSRVGFSTPTDRADALLIASAPDLLHACEVALRALEFDLTGDGKRDLSKLLTETIALARGGR